MADKILFKTPISACFGLEPRKLTVLSLHWSDQILYVLSDEYFQDDGSSFFEEFICDFEDSKIEFDRSILIYSRDPRSIRSNIRSDKIELFYIALSYELMDDIIVEDTCFQEWDIFLSERLDRLDIDTDDASWFSDDLREYLHETPWCTCHIEDTHAWLYEIIFFLYLEEFECTSCSIAELFGFLEIRILDDKCLCHNVKKNILTFVVKTIGYSVDFSCR